MPITAVRASTSVRPTTTGTGTPAAAPTAPTTPGSLDNTFSRTTAENVDVKEGTVGGLISGNTFDGSGMDPQAADSWVDIKGNNYTVSRNRGFAAPVDGFQTHVQLHRRGVGNVFTDNVVHVDAAARVQHRQGGGRQRRTLQQRRRVGGGSGLSDLHCH